MWFPPLEKIHSTDESTLFILLSWDEMFISKTIPDSFKPKLMDSLALLNEFKKVAEDVKKDERWKPHLSVVYDELKTVVNKDPILKSKYPLIVRTVKLFDPAGKESHIQAVRIATVAIQKLKKYRSDIIELLKNSCTEMPQEKRNMQDALMRLGTRVLLEGADSSGFLSIVTIENLSCTPTEIVDKIIEVAIPKEQNWFCIIPLEGEINFVRSFINKNKFKLLPTQDKPLGPNGKLFSERNKNTQKIFIELPAKSPVTAMQGAIQKLRKPVDITNFYNNGAPVKIGTYTIAVNGRDSRIVDLGEHYYSGLKRPNGITNFISEAIESIRSSKDSRIISALEQHTTAYSSVDIKVRFLNLWVALETLVGHSNGSIINRVTKCLIPILVGFKIRQQVKYLAMCLHEMGFCGKIPDESGFFKMSSNKEIPKDELFMALMQDDGAPVLNELIRVTRPQKLLCNKLTNLREIIKHPVVLKKEFETTESRITWQIRRIYRARNLLTHEGRRIENLQYLLDNLQFYFSMTVSKIINELTFNKPWTVDDCFEYRKIKYEYLLDSLQHKKEILKCSDIIFGNGLYRNDKLYPLVPENNSYPQVETPE